LFYPPAGINNPGQYTQQMQKGIIGGGLVGTGMAISAGTGFAGGFGAFINQARRLKQLEKLEDRCEGAIELTNVTVVIQATHYLRIKKNKKSPNINEKLVKAKPYLLAKT
jgi:hypothetical protein